MLGPPPDSREDGPRPERGLFTTNSILETD